MPGWKRFEPQLIATDRRKGWTRFDRITNVWQRTLLLKYEQIAVKEQSRLFILLGIP